MLFLSVAVKRFKYSSAMIVSMQNCSPGAQTNNWDKLNGKDWIPPPFLYKIPRFPFREKKSYYHLRQMFSLKVTLAFFREERALKSSHFMALSPFCITNHCTAIPHPELGHYSFHGLGVWQNRFLSKNHQKDLYKTKALNYQKENHLQFLKVNRGQLPILPFPDNYLFATTQNSDNAGV